MFKVIERIFKDKIATEDISLQGSQRFRGKLVGEAPAAVLQQCCQACPVHAMTVQGDTYSVDYKKCIFCGKCLEVAGNKAYAAAQQDGAANNASETADTLSLAHEDPMPYIIAAGQEVLPEVFRRKLGRSLHIRHLDAGSCNACDFEMGAMSNPYYDLHRYGVAVAASPRHADLLMVTGVVTRNLEQALKMTYESMAEPRLVMACGACAAGGETYGDTYAIVGSADKVVPVDIYVPGCPPRPSAMIAGLLAAADMLADK